MKHLFLPLAIVTLAVAPAVHAAAGLQTSTPKPRSTSATPAPKSGSATKTSTPKTMRHVVNAEFVAYDSAAKTITVKEANGQTASAPVESRAAAAAARFKKGDMVTLTWRDGANGEHQAVAAIRPAKRKA